MKAQGHSFLNTVEQQLVWKVSATYTVAATLTLILLLHVRLEPGDHIVM